jgi:hypothetical protein
LVIMTIARSHLSLAVSNGAPRMPDRRTESLERAYACQDMALRADNTEDRTALRGMATVWMILAQRTSPKPGFLTEPKN